MKRKVNGRGGKRGAGAAIAKAVFKEVFNEKELGMSGSWEGQGV